MFLYNRINRDLLKEKIAQSTEKRITLSFYRYHQIGNPQVFRDHLYLEFSKLGVLGRIYVAKEGINAQISVPEEKFEEFKNFLYSIDFLNGVRLNIAVEDNGKSFFKLKIQVKQKIVADGLNDETFDASNIGIHLSAEEFNELTDNPETIVVDMRNHYESEVGHFENAITPDVDTFREALPVVEQLLKGKEDKPIVMYCTGGIRCEKASAYFKHKGFKHVYQLEGGIIKYAQDVKKKGLRNKFKGKNFVFDERLGERISDDIISNCHQCGKPCDTHTNCKNEACNLLFIQCDECASRFAGCCSDECKEVSQWDEEKRKEWRKGKDSGIRIFTKGRFPKQSIPKMSFSEDEN
ncbi:MAG: rhodanese-related sulfurtransferase [Flammeovirgaceae bacterium]|nr:rhodanese-related sulfurtransferase [Flammeovirgaceae bacterium]MDW8286634.1 rhodanese-related sulfurtransferase [Flammeovirgaceae bacterium]